MNTQSLGAIMSLLINIFAILGGLVSGLALYVGAKERGAKDERITQLEKRVSTLETKDEKMMEYIIDIGKSLARIEGGISALQSIKPAR